MFYNRKRIKNVLVCFISCIALLAASGGAVHAETYIKVTHVSDGEVRVVTYSTEKQETGEIYSLYEVRKVGGQWIADKYLRGIEMPAADKPINGKKYKYKSERSEEIEWLKKRTVYRLFPEEKETKDHPSVPFWKNPLS